MLHFNKTRTIWALLILFVLFTLTGCFDGRGDGTGKQNNGVSNDNNGQNNLVQCPLSGDMVQDGTTTRRPLAVMIENAPAARPQSGLDKADIVYEIMAEGGITRFLTIFLHSDTDKLGPVRSARPYYIERMLEYDAMYAFCGGSVAALDMVKNEGVASLNEFAVGRKAYWRIKGRKAPHNLYTDTLKLRQAGAKKGYEKSVKLPEFRFLNQGEENSDGIESASLEINYQTKYSVVKWNYEKSANKYLRYEGGKPHRDAVTGKQLTASNVIVQYVKSRVIDKEGRLAMDMTGRGKTVLFTRGKAYVGTWSKAQMRSQTYFYGTNGEVLKLTPGQTWIEVVPVGVKVNF